MVDGLVGPFTDVYALGMTFLQLLTGASNPVGIRKIVNDAVQSVDGTQDGSSKINHVVDPSLKLQNAAVRQAFLTVLHISHLPQ